MKRDIRYGKVSGGSFPPPSDNQLYPSVYIDKKKYAEIEKAGEYIEIVHTNLVMLDSFRKQGSEQKAIADRISELDETIGVTYEMGDLRSDPYLPKDTPIRIGGGMWEICVPTRAKNLRKLGYQNVKTDRQISFAIEDD